MDIRQKQFYGWNLENGAKIGIPKVVGKMETGEKQCRRRESWENWDSAVWDVYAGLSREEMKGNGASGRVEQNRNVQCDDCYW